MAALTPSVSERPHVGDVKWQIYDFAAVANADTFTLPAGTRILGIVILRCGTSASITGAVAANVITFNVSAGNPTARIAVLIE